MTKSTVLILGDDPERLMARHLEAYESVLVNVTDKIEARAGYMMELGAPAGVSPTPGFRRVLAIRKAIAQTFQGAPYWVYDDPGDLPKQRVLHNHVIYDQGRLVGAFQKEPDTGFADDAYQEETYRNNPFSSWWEPDQGCLPLSALSGGERYHAKTRVFDGPGFYAGGESSNSAALCDVDLARIARARQETTDDLINRASAVLREEGLDGGFDWSPQFQMDWGDIKKDPGYFDQDKPKLLHERLPDHKRRIDFLLLDPDDLGLFVDWSGFPVAGLVTRDGYESVTNYPSRDAGVDARFFQITQTSRAFLKVLAAHWQSSAPQTRVSVMRAHE